MSLGAISGNAQEFSVAQTLRDKSDRLLQHIGELQRQLDDERKFREGKYAGLPTDAISLERFELLRIVGLLHRRIDYEFETLAMVQAEVLLRAAAIIPAKGPSPHPARTPIPIPIAKPLRFVSYEAVGVMTDIAAWRDLIAEGQRDLLAINETEQRARASVALTEAAALRSVVTRRRTSICTKDVRKGLTVLRGQMRGVREDVAILRQAFGVTFQKCVETMVTSSQQKDTIVRYHRHVVDMANQNISLLLELKSEKTSHKSHTTSSSPEATSTTKRPPPTT